MSKVRIAGVGMIPFTKPGQSEDWDVMAERAIRLALTDAGVTYDQIQQAYAGYVYGDSTAGQSMRASRNASRTAASPSTGYGVSVMR